MEKVVKSVMDWLQRRYDNTLRCSTVSRSVLPAFLQISSGTYAEPGRDAMSLWESAHNKRTQRNKKKA